MRKEILDELVRKGALYIAGEKHYLEDDGKVRLQFYPVVSEGEDYYILKLQKQHY
jgi:hypothetical protein